MIDVVTTRTEVIRHGDHDLEWLQTITSDSVAQGWRAWCHICADYDPTWHRTRFTPDEPPPCPDPTGQTAAGLWRRVASRRDAFNQEARDLGVNEW